MIYSLSRWGVISISTLAKPLESVLPPYLLGAVTLPMHLRPPALSTVILTSQPFLPTSQPKATLLILTSGPLLILCALPGMH